MRSGKQRDDSASVVAEIHHVTADYVRKVGAGERENEDIMATLVDYQVGKNALIEHLKTLVPIKPNPAKYGRG